MDFFFFAIKLSAFTVINYQLNTAVYENVWLICIYFE